MKLRKMLDIIRFCTLEKGPLPMFRLLLRLRALACVAVALFVLGGCATNGNPQDPLESLNRGVYKFNDVADHLIIKPAAEIYRGLVPAIVRTGVGNFFSNINDVIVALNSLLQGKVTQACTIAVPRSTHLRSSPSDNLNQDLIPNVKTVIR